MFKYVMCPHCGCVDDYSPPDHKFCRNCGKELPKDLKPLNYTCPKCKLTRKDGHTYGTAEYCEFCGTKL
jgi:hypothetical protein